VEDPVNFTATVDRELLKQAKVLAAKSKASVNVLFSVAFRNMVDTFEATEAVGNQNFKTLFDFSIGRVAYLQAMENLGIETAMSRGARSSVASSGRKDCW